MRYAVEGRFFDNGKVVAKMRPVAEGEESCCKETRTCDIWVDVFDTREEAQSFLNDYKKA